MKQLYGYLLFDAAKATEEKLNIAQEQTKIFISLYRGRSEENLAVVGPYLFPFPHSIEFSQFILQSGWGNAWGLFAFTKQTIEETNLHFRKFLLVKTEKGEELYFRFYDPRVLRIFLPTCDETQLKEFFGPIEKFICEDEDKEFAIEFTLLNNQLNTRRFPAQEFFDSVPKDTPSQSAPTATIDSPIKVDHEAIRKKQNREPEKSRWGKF